MQTSFTPVRKTQITHITRPLVQFHSSKIQETNDIIETIYMILCIFVAAQSNTVTQCCPLLVLLQWLVSIFAQALMCSEKRNNNSSHT